MNYCSRFEVRDLGFQLAKLVVSGEDGIATQFLEL
jgi:hypothetical protein